MSNFRYSVSRDKNIFTLTGYDRYEGKTRVYTFDVNTATLTNSKGKVMMSWPVNFKSNLIDDRNLRNSDNALVMLSVMMTNPYYLKLPHWGSSIMSPEDVRVRSEGLFKVLDKLQSINYRINPNHSLNFQTFRFIDDNFKLFAKWYKDNPDKTIEDFRKENERLLWKNKHPEIANYHLTEAMENFLYNTYRDASKEKIAFVAYTISRGLWEFCGGSVYTVNNYIANYCRMCDEMEIPYEYGDFYRTFINTKRIYEMRKKEIDQAKIVNQYKKHLKALQFEDDNFIVVIPKSSEDFKEEADAQNNCVYSMYLDRVTRGDTNVVFIRRKTDPAKPYITCEVINNGNIWQYLYKCNCQVTDELELDFKNAYQCWLNENW